MGLIIGIDDAGRGPLIGPMVLAGVLLDRNSEKVLKGYKVRDSKLLSHKTRIRMAELIKKIAIDFEIVISLPKEIDNSLKKGVNLNALEAKKTAEIIERLIKERGKIKIIVDCPSVNTVKWKKILQNYLIEGKENDIVCEHKADQKYVSVSAASIIAKVKREEEIDKLKKKYGNFGSGYPSDPLTKKFLLKNGKKFSDKGIFRKSWSTWKRLFSEKEQVSLKEFI